MDLGEVKKIVRLVIRDFRFKNSPITDEAIDKLRLEELRLKDVQQPDEYAEAKDFTTRLIYSFAHPDQPPVNDPTIAPQDLELNWQFFEDDDPEGRPTDTESHHLTWSVLKFCTDKIQYSVFPK
jgi:hypothetical protein